jgi:hypothetical protein
MEYYTYLWLREDGTPYYVGKGCGSRAFERSGHTCLPPKDKNRVVLQGFADESEALTADRFLIAYYGRLDLGNGCLRNLTNGGDGVSGLQHSLETKMTLSEQRRFKPLSQQTRRKMQEAMRIRGVSKSSIDALRRESAKRKGKSCEGRTHTEETKQLLARKMQGNQNGKSRGKAYLQYHQALLAQEAMRG